MNLIIDLFETQSSALVAGTPNSSNENRHPPLWEKCPLLSKNVSMKGFAPATDPIYEYSRKHKIDVERYTISTQVDIRPELSSRPDW